MPRITHITAQKRHTDRFNCFLDTEERITVSSDMLLRHGLARNMELTASQLTEIRREADIYFTREKALYLLSMRDHSRMELRRKLLQKEYGKAAIDEALAYLEEKNYVNDARFAKLYFRELFLNKRFGPSRIREKMFDKGIGRELLDPLLAGVSDREWDDNCRYHAEKKRIDTSDAKKYREKMTRFLMGRGFSWQMIAPVLDELTGRPE